MVFSTSEDISTGTYTGTKTYMSPQVFLDQRYTNKTDVWSTGVVFLAMLILQRPNVKQYKFEPINPSTVNISDKRLDNFRRCICTKMIVEDEKQRFSVKQVIEHAAFRDHYGQVEKAASDWLYGEDEDKDRQQPGSSSLPVVHTERTSPTESEEYGKKDSRSLSSKAVCLKKISFQFVYI